MPTPRHYEHSLLRTLAITDKIQIPAAKEVWLEMIPGITALAITATKQSPEGVRYNESSL